MDLACRVITLSHLPGVDRGAMSVIQWDTVRIRTGLRISSGFVHPYPRTHGCIRLHGEAAPKFFALVKIGTPVSIRQFRSRKMQPLLRQCGA